MKGKRGQCADCGREEVLALAGEGRMVCIMCASAYALPSITPRGYGLEYDTKKGAKA